MAPAVAFELNGGPVSVDSPTISLLDALREVLGVRSAKDGCAPQGQCGCCTVLVDGQPRVACVTPVARVAGRSVTTVEGLDPDVRGTWAEAFCSAGGSQCGFCTPGILMRMHALRGRGVLAGDRAAVDKALLAHLCRCTGWQTIRETYDQALFLFSRQSGDSPGNPRTDGRKGDGGRRAGLEGGVVQAVGPEIALGLGGFADDTAPPGALVALRSAAGEWVVGETLATARVLAGTVQGRRTTESLRWPVDVPPGDWDRTLQTTWVEPAYLEPDASWCEPGGEPATPLANGGAFGGKATAAGTEVAQASRRLAAEHDRPVRARWTREDVARNGPKRPPLAAALRADGSGAVRLAAPPGSERGASDVAARIRASWPAVTVALVSVNGPPVSAALRAAGWAEVAALHASLRPGPDRVVTADGAWAEASVDPERVTVRVHAGDPLDRTVLRSYSIGAAHQALGWVRSEGIAVGDDGIPRDLTIRSFGILRAADMPHVDVEIVDETGPARRVGDAVFAAVAAAAWRALGFPPRWPAIR